MTLSSLISSPFPTKIQKHVDETIYKLVIQANYSFESIIPSLKHYLSYLSFMHPEITARMNEILNESHIRMRFAYVDYKLQKTANTNVHHTQNVSNNSQSLQNEITLLQQTNHSLQEQMDKIMLQSTQKDTSIQNLNQQITQLTQKLDDSVLKQNGLQSDIQQLNKEINRYREELQVYRQQENEERQKEHQEAFKDYQRESQPSGFSIFKNSLKKDFDEIYSTVKHSLPKIEFSSDDEEADSLERAVTSSSTSNDSIETPDAPQIYETNLPPPTDFERKLGQSLFPKEITGQNWASKELTGQNWASKESNVQRAAQSKKMNDITLEDIERDIHARESEWDADFQNAINTSQSTAVDEEKQSNVQLNITERLGSIDLDNILNRIDSNAPKNDQSPAESNNPQESNEFDRRRAERRRQRMMNIPEYDD